MTAYENDVFVIPDRYKKMSVSELEKEKSRVLSEVNCSERLKKEVKTDKNGIVFKF